MFVLGALVPFVEGRRLTTTGILATKLHAILDRGVRRDFFDLYVTLQKHSLGIRECLAAMREWLKTEYADLMALNEQWGTGFKSWEQVKPLTLKECKARRDGNYSAWSDHRN